METGWRPQRSRPRCERVVLHTRDTGAVAFLDALTAADGDALRICAVSRRYARGTALFHERQPPECVHLLIAGEVKLTSTLASGREVMLGIRGAGDLLGEISALDGLPRSAAAVALSDVDAWVIGLADWNVFLDRSPHALRELLRTLADRLRESDRATIEFTRHDAVGRLAVRLLALADRYGRSEGEGLRLELPISQEELGTWIGASRETVAKALQTLRELGWIETGRRTVVLRDPSALERFVAAR